MSINQRGNENRRVENRAPNRISRGGDESWAARDRVARTVERWGCRGWRASLNGRAQREGDGFGRGGCAGRKGFHGGKGECVGLEGAEMALPHRDGEILSVTLRLQRAQPGGKILSTRCVKKFCEQYWTSCFSYRRFIILPSPNSHTLSLSLYLLIRHSLFAAIGGGVSICRIGGFFEGGVRNVSFTLTKWFRAWNGVD